jgi:KDO2-lipid IV(A) lauroyltransferase
MLAWLSYSIADGLVRVLPARVADRLGIGIARLAFAARLPARARLEENLARLLGRTPPPGVEAVAREAFENFALTFTDFLRLGHGAPGLVTGAVEVRGAEHLEAARRSGRGVILLSAHLGNWELGAAWLAAGGTPLNLAARPHPSRWVERFYARRRGAWGVRLLPGRPLWRDAAGALRRREWVALMADREASPGVTARRSSVCAWAAALSQRTGAVVLPAVIVRLPDRRYAACFERPLDAATLRTGDFVESLRHQLRRHARQWFAFEALPEGLA